MKTLCLTVNIDTIYPIEKFAPKENILFIDIETTGFTARKSTLYLIGCMYYAKEQWKLIQWFAEKNEEELSVLTAFLSFAKDYSFMIHYNGNRFDIPYLMEKCRSYEIECSLLSCEGLDLYKRIAPYHHLLKLENCKQKTIENYLGLKRTGDTDAAELIGLYFEYLKTPDEFLLESIILHNALDLKGMVKCVDMMAVYDLFHEEVTPYKVSSHQYTDYYDSIRTELWMHFTLNAPLPRPLAIVANECRFSGEALEGKLRVPVFEGQLCYFYSNYEQYYYLPEEDTAIHKSVSEYVGRNRRVQATPSTCYTRKSGLFLPMWGIIFEPFFKESYKAKQVYFELTQELKTDREAFKTYAVHLLQMLGSNNFRE